MLKTALALAPHPSRERAHFFMDVATLFRRARPGSRPTQALRCTLLKAPPQIRHAGKNHVFWRSPKRTRTPDPLKRCPIEALATLLGPSLASALRARRAQARTTSKIAPGEFVSQ